MSGTLWRTCLECGVLYCRHSKGPGGLVRVAEGALLIEDGEHVALERMEPVIRAEIARAMAAVSPGGVDVAMLARAYPAFGVARKVLRAACGEG